jgi:hypothetical protein
VFFVCCELSGTNIDLSFMANGCELILARLLDIHRGVFWGPGSKSAVSKLFTPQIKMSFLARSPRQQSAPREHISEDVL